MKKSLLLALMCLLVSFATMATTTVFFTATHATPLCSGTPIYITNLSTSTNPAAKCEWTSSGSGSSWYNWNTPTPDPLTYYSPGASMVTLSIIDSNTHVVLGSYSISFTVYTTPNVMITTSPTTPTLSCPGDTITLIATSTDTTVHTFVWTLPSSATDTIANFRAGVMGIYRVQAISNHGCASYPNNIFVNGGTPLASNLYVNSMTRHGDTATACSGDIPNIGTNVWGGTAPYTYYWNTGSTSNVINPVTISGNYKVTIHDSHGCVVKDSIIAIINPTPSATITSSSSALSHCAGDTVTLSVPYTSGCAYWWNTGSTTDSAMITSYGYASVTVVSGAGCVSTNTYSSVFYTSPTPAINVSPSVWTGGSTDTVTVCTNMGSTISAYPIMYSGLGYTFHWNTGSTSSSIPAATSGLYTVTIHDVDGCNASKSVWINRYAPPDSTLTLSHSGTLCTGDVQVVRLPPGNTYFWSTFSPLDSIVVTASGYYTASITNVHGCVSNAAYNAVFHTTPAPTVTVGPCNMEVGVINAGAHYQWYMLGTPISGATSTFYSALGSNDYTVKETSSAGCAAFAPFAWVSCSGGVIYDSIHADFAIGTSVLCGPGNILYNNATSLTDSMHIVWNWTFDGGTPATSTAKNPGSVHYSLAGIHNAMLVVHDTMSGFTSTHTATILVDSISIDAYGYSTISGLGDTICHTNDPHVGVNVYTGGSPTYVWSTGGVTSSISIPVSGTYSVTVIDSHGCSKADAVTITLLGSPDSTISVISTGAFCAGDTEVLSLVTGNSYAWSNGLTTHSIDVTVAGTYSVTITDVHGCKSTARQTVILSPAPTPAIIAYACNMSVDSVGFSGSSYKWYESGAPILGATTSTYIALAPGFYYVQETNSLGCIGSSVPIYDTPCTGVVITPIDTCGLYPQATPSVVSGDGGCMLSSSIISADSFAWYVGGVFIQSSNHSTMPASVPGFYAVECTNSHGCHATSTPFWGACDTSVPIVIPPTGNEIGIYPNPCSDILNVSFMDNGEYHISITDILGQIVQEVDSKDKFTVISLNNVASGIYIVSVHNGRDLIKVTKVVKQ